MLTGPSTRRNYGWLAAIVLTLSMGGVAGCTFNGATNWGMTRKWVQSDVNIFPKIVGSIPIGIIDGVISPFTALADYIGSDDEAYAAGEWYLSYAGSRTIADSTMPEGWRLGMSIISIPLDTVWLILSLPVDVITILCCGRDVDTEEELLDPDLNFGESPGEMAADDM